ncbi:MAG: hypothetical protein VYC11_06745 [Candidatus Thermoplasmatota archaeon]|nr:hypothetical protein [Candidatus Thermoplasmatota archaeon]MED5486212.1 hypothetical protein [Candidatus Thermoplasmatota archaeon]|tara:strand:- start:86 stop:355 length:270 start_codon:yes stop_codon:yes gene_type:complete
MSGFGWVIVLVLSGILALIVWFQWRAYATLDEKIEQLDEGLVDALNTRVEKILDAPPGSMIMPYAISSFVQVQGSHQEIVGTNDAQQYQ